MVRFVHFGVRVRVGHFGSKLAENGPFWSFWVQIGQKWSVLVILGPDWPILVRFGHFGVRVRVGHFGSKFIPNPILSLPLNKDMLCRFFSCVVIFSRNSCVVFW